MAMVNNSIASIFCVMASILLEIHILMFRKEQTVTISNNYLSRVQVVLLVMPGIDTSHVFNTKLQMIRNTVDIG